MQVSDVPHVGLDAEIGLRVTSIDGDRVTAQLPLDPRLLGASGSTHHGVLSSAIESVASIAAAAHLGDSGHVVGVSNSTSHFRETSDGTLEVVAEPVCCQRDRQQWLVLITDDAGELVAQGNVQLVNVHDAGDLGTG